MKGLLLILLALYFSLFSAFSQQTSRIINLELPYITKNDVVVKHLGYTLSYNEKYEQANWVAYQLTAKETEKIVGRSNDFRPDTDVPTGSADNEDYKNSGYDRGHLAPAADMGWSSQAMEESFFYSNMSPQLPGFNRGIWKRLEEQVRQWAVDNQAIYVVTGPVLRPNLPTIGHDKVAIPNYYYKVILDYTQPELKGIGFIMPNTSSTLALSNYAVTIDSVETVTGINFFPALPNDQERSIEKSICLECWSWNATPTHKTKSVHSTSSSVQCSGITKSGNRCKRMTKNASGFCSQHDKE
jgi:endonuclease G, mitochondrial